MGALTTCCGFYCAMTSLVGIYFFFILAIMEWRGNSFLVQIIQNVEEEPNEKQIDNNMKATAYAICGVVQIVFTVACYACGMKSIRSDEAKEKQKEMIELQLYSRADDPA